MTEKGLQHGTPRSLSRPGRLLGLVLLAAAVLGAAALVYLALLPSDPEGRILGPYSARRLILMSGPILGSAALALLGAKALRNREWGERTGGRLFSRVETVPRILGVFASLGMLLGAAAFIWRPEFVLGLTAGHVERLLPYLVWPMLIAVTLYLAWLWEWHGAHWRLTSGVVDCGMGGVLVLISFAVRYPVTSYGLPYQTVWDEVVTYSRALRILGGPGVLPSESILGYNRSAYGDLLISTTAVGETVGFLAGLRAEEIHSLEEFVTPPAGVSSILEAVHPSGIPLRYPRLLISFLNSLAPALVYFTLRRTLGASRWASLAGGAIYGFLSPEVVYYTSFILPDGLATTLAVSAILTAMMAIGRRRRADLLFLASGAAAGLALSVSLRYISLVAVPMLALAATRDKEGLFRKLALISGGALAGFLITSPTAVGDTPTYLGRLADLVWAGDPSIEHRLESLAFYLQGMFSADYVSPYVSHSNGTVGLGLPVLILAALGTGALVVDRPRFVFPLLGFAVVHLFLISPIVQRYTRHALVLYPVAAILAGAGLDWSAAALSRLVQGVRSAADVGRFAGLRRLPRDGRLIGQGLVGIVFVALSLSQLGQTVRYVEAASTFQTSQSRIAQYLQATLPPGETVGILGVVPWVEADLRARGITYERISIEENVPDLLDQGITYVVGTDRIEDEYGSVAGTIWATAFASPGARLYEVGEATLHFRSYPVGSIYLFVARLSPG